MVPLGALCRFKSVNYIFSKDFANLALGSYYIYHRLSVSSLVAEG